MGISQSRKDITCVVIGDSGVGKTSLINKWRLKFVPQVHQPTKCVLRHDLHLVAHSGSQKYGTRFRFIVYEIGGDIPETTMQHYLERADVIVMMYDVTKAHTLDTLDYWWPWLQQLMGQEKPLCVLVGNKDDNPGYDREPLCPIKRLCPEEAFDVSCSNVISLADESSARASTLCYQILKKAYCHCRRLNAVCVSLSMDSRQYEDQQHPDRQRNDSGTIPTFRIQDSTTEWYR